MGKAPAKKREAGLGRVASYYFTRGGREGEIASRERKGLIRRVVRYGHGAAAFPVSIMEVLFGSLCLRDEDR